MHAHIGLVSFNIIYLKEGQTACDLRITAVGMCHIVRFLLLGGELLAERCHTDDLMPALKNVNCRNS